jgi:chromosome segregation ATPase
MRGDGLPELTFNDGLIRIHTKGHNSASVQSFSFDFSPGTGRIARFAALTRYAHLTELSLVGHKFADASALKNLAQLTKLNLSWNAIADMGFATSLVLLEQLNLCHNRIKEIPDGLTALANLAILNLAFNRIIREAEIAHLKGNQNLQTVDFEGNLFMNDQDSFLFIVYSLPSLTAVNRRKIQREHRIQATQKFAGIAPSARPQPRPGDASALQLYMEEAQDRRVESLRALEENTADKHELRTRIAQLRSAAAFAKTVSERPKPDDDAHDQIRALKKKLLTLKSENARLTESLEFEKTLNLKQKQMIIHLKEKYANERRLKEPKLPRSNTQSTPPKKSAEIRAEIVAAENKKLLARIEKLETEAEFHVRELEVRGRQIQALSMNSSVSSEKGTKILEYQSTIAAQADEIASLTSQIALLKDAQSETMATFEATVRENDSTAVQLKGQIEGLESALSAKNNLIQTLKAEVQTKDLTIEDLNAKLPNSDARNRVLQAEDESDPATIRSLTEQIEILKAQGVRFENERARLNEALRQAEMKLRGLADENEALRDTGESVEESQRVAAALRNERDCLTARMRHEIRIRDERIELLEQSIEFTAAFEGANEGETVGVQELRRVQRMLADARGKIESQESMIASLKEGVASAHRDCELLQTKLARRIAKLEVAAQEREHLAEQVRELKKSITLSAVSTGSPSESDVTSLGRPQEPARQLNEERPDFLEKFQKARTELNKLKLLFARLLIDIENTGRIAGIPNPTIAQEISENNYVLVQELLQNIESEFNKLKKEVGELRVQLTQNQLHFSGLIAKQASEIEQKNSTIRSLRNQSIELEQASHSLMQEIELHKQKQKADESLQISQLDTASEIDGAKLRSLEETAAKLTGKKTALKLAQARLSAEVRELNKTVRSKSAEIDRLKMQLQNSETTHTEFASSIEAIEQRSQIKELSLRNELNELEGLWKASQMREEQLVTENDCLGKSNHELAQKVKHLQRKVTDAKIDLSQLQLAVQQIQGANSTAAAEKDQEISHYVEVIDGLREELHETRSGFQEQNSSLVNVKQGIEFQLSMSQNENRKLSKRLARMAKLCEETAEERDEVAQSNEALREEGEQLRAAAKSRDEELRNVTASRDTNDHLFKTLTQKYNDLQAAYFSAEETITAERKAPERSDLIRRAEESERKAAELQKECLLLREQVQNLEENTIQLTDCLSNLELQLDKAKSARQEAEPELKKYIQRLNDAQKTIQLLQDQFKENSQLNQTLSSQLADTKESMVDRRSYDELTEKALLVKRKKNQIKESVKELDETISQLTLANRQKDLALENHQQQITSLQQQIGLRDRQLEQQSSDLHKTIDEKVSEIEQLNHELQDLQLQLSKATELVKVRSREIGTAKSMLSGEIERLRAESDVTRREILAKDQQISQLLAEIQTKDREIQAAQKQAEVNWDDHAQKMRELDEKEKKMDSEYESHIRDLAKAKREIRILTDEKAQFHEKLVQNERHIQQLSERVEGCVPRDIFQHLSEKYDEVKKLKRFSEDKVRNLSFEMSREREAFQKQMAEREDQISNELRGLTATVKNQKNIIVKLTSEIQSLQRKLSAWQNPGSEKVPKKEVTLAEEQAHLAEAKAESMSRELQQKVEENSQLQQHLGKKQRSEERQRARIREFKSRMQSLAEVESRIGQVHDQLDGKRCTVGSIAKELNDLFGYLGLERIELANAPRFWVLRSAHLFESPPDILDRFRNLRKMLGAVKAQLCRFPISSDVGRTTGTNEVEEDIRQLGELVGMVRALFKDQGRRIRDMESLIATQHSAIVQISDPSGFSKTPPNQ